MTRRSLLLPLLLAACAAPPAAASVITDMVAQVTVDTYTKAITTQLYAEDGDNRGLTGAEHDLARASIFNAFQSFGLATSLGPQTYNNVVGIQTGTVRPNDIYIVGAHYDSVSNPGADDNASGVAGVLEAARVLHEYQFAATLIFMAFDREEQGLIGSTAYANAHSADNIRGMISLDMIGYSGGSPARARTYGTDASAAWYNGLVSAAATYGGLAVTTGGSLPYSDHWPFEAIGKPAAVFIEYNWSGNPYYHKQSDSLNTADYFDYAYAANMTRSVVGYLAESAQPVPEPGTWVAGILIVVCYTARRVRAH